MVYVANSGGGGGADRLVFVSFSNKTTGIGERRSKWKQGPVASLLTKGERFTFNGFFGGGLFVIFC